jgi:hypothetical protein
MATYYLDPGAGSHGTGTKLSPFKNLYVAGGTAPLGQTVALSGGDLLVIKGGSVIREMLGTRAFAPASQVRFVGDWDGSLWPESGGYGRPRWSAWISGDNAAPSTTGWWDGAISYVSLENLIVQPYSTRVAWTSHHVTFANCVILSYSAGNALNMWLYSTADGNIRFTRNLVLGCGMLFSTSGLTTPVDLAYVVDHNLFLGGGETRFYVDANTLGYTCFCNTLFGSLFTVTGTGAGATTPRPVAFANNLAWNSAVGVSSVANAAYSYGGNRWYVAANTNLNLEAGATDYAGYAPYPALALDRWGLDSEALFVPRADWLCAGHVATYTGALDASLRPRPAGLAARAQGAFEPRDSGVMVTSPVDAGTYAYSLAAGRHQEHRVLVAADTTALTIKLQTDGSYAGNLPTVTAVAGECLAADVTATATAAASGAYETLTLSISPTKAGWITLRVWHAGTAGTLYVDTAGGS